LFPDEPSIEKDGYHARGGTSRGEDEGRRTDWCKGAVASGIASATTQASVCSKERSTGRSVEPTFDKAGSPDPGAANSPGAERCISNSGSSPPRAAAASQASRHDHGGGPFHWESGTSRSSANTSTTAANQPLHRPPSWTSPCAKRRRQGDGGGPKSRNSCGSPQ
jgi:hypothetical protein